MSPDRWTTDDAALLAVIALAIFLFLFVAGSEVGMLLGRHV